jgi:hypothetical protein
MQGLEQFETFPFGYVHPLRRVYVYIAFDVYATESIRNINLMNVHVADLSECHHNPYCVWLDNWCKVELWVNFLIVLYCH